MMKIPKGYSWRGIARSDVAMQTTPPNALEVRDGRTGNGNSPLINYPDNVFLFVSFLEHIKCVVLG